MPNNEHATPRGQYKQFWPEQCELATHYDANIPPWRVLEAQGAMVRNALVHGEVRKISDTKRSLELERLPDAEVDTPDKPPVSIPYGPHHRRFGTVPDAIDAHNFDIHNIHCFQWLPVIGNERERIAQIASRLTSANRRPLAWALKRDLHGVEEVKNQVRQEMGHSMYLHAMWRRYGRRVYVLDETTYTLLSETPLPELPASILSMPQHAFYLVLPKTQGFKFGVWNHWDEKEDVQAIEGILVSMDNIDPDSNTPRELTFMTVGAGDTIDDRNIAYISVTMGSDAKLSDIRFPGAGAVDTSLYTIGDDNRNAKYANSLLSGSYELGVITPRVILGFLLYLASEHPDIEPVPPAPRRTFQELYTMSRSEKKAQAGLENQETRLRGATRLPIFYVGRHLKEEVEKEQSGILQTTPLEHRQWVLDHPVWVSGHWKRQAYGPGRGLRKMLWIRPYLKGPDVAEVIKARAAKVQRAQAAHEPPQVKVQVEQPAKLNRMKR